MAILTVANDTQLMTIRAVTEATPGAGGVPTFFLPGTMEVNETRPLADINTYNGTYMQDDLAVYGPTDLAGSYGQNLSYEKAAILPRYALSAAPTPVSDGNPTPGFTYTYLHDQARATRQTFAAIFGFEELPFDIRGVRFPQLSISADIDDAEASWKVNCPSLFASSKDLFLKRESTATAGTATTVTTADAGITLNQYQAGWLHIIGGPGDGQALKIASNTASPNPVFTVSGTFSPAAAAGSIVILVGPVATVTATTDEAIACEGSNVFVDDTLAIGTTNDRFRVISWNLDWNWPVSPKRFMGNVGGYDAKIGNGPQRLSGSLRMEFDSPKEYQRFKVKDEVKLRFSQTGSVINASPATNKSITIDVYRAVLEAPTMDARNYNRTITIPWRAYRDATQNRLFSYAVKNKLTALP